MSIQQNTPSIFQKRTFFVRTPFIPAKLVEGKAWYIVFYAVNPQTETLKRIRIKFNKVKAIKMRRELARKMIAEINRKLEAGWNPFVTEDKRKSYTPLFGLLDEYLKFQLRSAEKNSMRCYKSFVKFFQNWLEKKGYSEELMVNQFTDNIASDLMESIRSNTKISYRTYNNYLAFFLMLWNWLIEYNYASSNPFHRFHKFPKKLLKKQRVTLSEQERSRLMTFLSTHNRNYLCICYLCYYCFLRPKEISMLKIKDIDLDKQLIFVRAEIAKNDRDSVRTIPDVAIDTFRQLDLAGRSGDDYIFSWDKLFEFVPGRMKMDSRNIAKYWEKVIRKQLGWNLDKQFYSLKDTGITNMLTDNIAPNVVQSQADHTSLSITSIYIQKNKGIQQQIKTGAKSFDKN